MTRFWDRFWDWSLDHPWKFVGLYAVVIGSLSALMTVIWTPLGVGMFMGLIFGIARLSLQNLRFAKDERERAKEWDQMMRRFR